MQASLESSRSKINFLNNSDKGVFEQEEVIWSKVVIDQNGKYDDVIFN